MAADRQRITPVEYNEKTYEVIENYWERADQHDELAVSLSVADRNFGRSTDRQDVHKWLREKVEAVEVLGALDYRVYDCDDGVIFWKKKANESNSD